MADSRTIQINLKAVSNFSDVVNNAKQLQGIFEKLKLPDSLKSSLDKIFADIEKNGEKASQAMTNGFKTKGDVSSFERSINNINTSMERLVQTTSKMDSNLFASGELEKEIKAVDKQIKSLQQEIDKLSTSKMTEVTNAFKESEKFSQAVSWKQFFDAFQKGTAGVGEAEKAFNRLQAEVEKAKTKLGDKAFSESDKWQNYAKQVKVFGEALSILKGETEETKQKKIELDAAFAKKNALKTSEAEQAAKAHRDVTAAIKEEKEEVDSLGKKTLEAGENTQHINSELDHFKSRITYFFGAANAVNLFKRAIRSAFETVKDLDKVMTETAVVTQFSVAEMWEQLPDYTRRANELGVTIHDAYESATIYYQQGLKTNQVMEVSNQTLKMARIAGLDAAEATDRMTNALRGFNMEINEVNAERVADVYSKLAAISASNVDEISTAMTKVASLANNANMEFETTAAFLSQIIETTRESAETAGTALKTVVARFSEVKKLYSEGELLGSDEEGQEVDVNKVSTALRTAGINLNEYLSGMKGLDDIFLELASKWDSLNNVQQRYIATMAAGSRQQSRFIAMMQDYGRTQELVNAAYNAGGASNEQYQKTLDSLESKLNRLKNAWDEFLMGIANNAIIKSVVDALTGLLNIINRITANLPGFLKSIGNIGIVFVGLKIGGAIFKKIFAGLGNVFMHGGQQAADGLAKGIQQNLPKVTIIARSYAKQLSHDFAKNLQLGKEVTFNDLITKISQIPSKAQHELVTASPALQTALENTLRNALDTAKIGQKAANNYVETFMNTLKAKGGDIQKAFNSISELSPGLGGKLLNTKVATQDLRNLQTSFSQLGSTVGKVSGIFYSFASILDGIGLSRTANAVRKIGSVFSALGGIVTSVGSLMISMGIKVQASWAVVIAVIAAAAAIVGGLYLIFRKGETEAEKLERQTEKAKEVAQEAKDSYNDLLSMKDTQDRLLEELNELTKGTTAWYNKLKEVNDQVMILIDKAPELSKFLSVGENGVLTIDQEGWNDYIEGQAVASRRLEGARYVLEANKTKEKGNETTEELMKSFESEAQRRSVAPDYKIGFGYEEAYNFVKDFYENPTKYLNGEKEPDFVAHSVKNKDGKTYGQIFYEEFMESYQNENDDWANTLVGLYKEIADNEAKSLEESRQNMRSALFGRFSGTDTSLSKFFNDAIDGVTTLFTDNMLDRYKEALEKVPEGDELTEKYKKITGKTDEQIKEEKTNVNEMKAAVAADVVQEYYANLVEKITNGGPELAALINPEKALSFTEQELKNINADTILQDSDLSEEEIAEISKYYNDVKKKTIEKIHDNLEQLGLSTENNHWYTNLKLSDKSNMTEQMLQVQKNSGQTGIYSFNKIMANMAAALPTEQFEEFVKQINNIDITDAKSIENLSTMLEGVDIDLSTFGIDVSDLEKKLISATRATRDFNIDNVRDQLKEGLDLADKLRSRKSYTFDKKAVREMVDTYDIDESNFEYNGQDWIYVGGTMEALSEAVRENTLATAENNRVLLEGKVKSGELFATVGQSSKQTSEEAREFFMEGKYTNAQNVRSYFEIAGQDSVIDSATGQTHKISEINDEQLMQIYSQMTKDYQNLETNKELLGEYDKVIGQNNSINPNAARAIQQGEQAGLDSTQIVQYAEQLERITRDSKDTKEISHDMATEIAKDNILMQNSIDELTKNWKEWKENLSDDNKGTSKYSEALTALQKNMQDLLGINRKLSVGFLTSKENMLLMEQAAKGDVEAVEKLRVAAAQDIIAHTKIDLDPESTKELNSYLTELTSQDYVIGTTLDNSATLDGLYDLLVEAGATAEDIQQAFNAIGWEPQLETETYTLSDADVRNGYVEVVDQPLLPGEKATTRKIPVQSGMSAGATIEIPKIRGEGKHISATYHGSAKAATTISPPSGGSGGGGGGGGSSKEKKPSYWENPYDELYNLSEKINESMRTREALERAYDKLLQKRSTSSRQIIQNSLDEVALLRQQLDYQRQMEAGRRKQIEAVGSQMYTDEEGNRTSFSDLGVTKYASYDFNSGLIQIDWTGLEEIANDASREEEGKQAEAYISKLEELVGQYEDVRDAVWEIEDTLEEVQKRGMGEYLELEERVYNALVEEQQRIIDSFDAMSQAIEEATSKVLDDVREQIDAERQQRQNEKTEEEISDKEARLAYLSRDTSGANQLETMKLQKEIDDARQNYSDSLVDQAIDEMRKDADLAAEQRAQQLKIMQAQLDIAAENGEFWPKVEELLRNSFTSEGNFAVNANLTQLLEATEAFKGMSEFGKQNWINEITEAWLKAIEGRANWEMKKAQDEGKLSLANGTQLNYKNGKWVDAKGNTYSDVAYDTKSGAFTGKSNNDAPKAPAPAAQSKPQAQAAPAPKTRSDTEVANRLKAMFNLANTGQVGAQPQRHQQWMAKGYSDAEARAAQEVIELVFGSAYGLDNAIKKVINNYGDKLRKYADGGMADYTGLAWLDGSRSKPEAILSAQDTKNFISLRDILAQFMGTQGANGIGGSGDNYFNIDINAEIGSDYDVDRLAERIKQQIYNDSTYRNVNAINFIR